MKKENTAIIITSIVAGAVILIALLAMFVFIPMSSSTSNTVTVQGTSTIHVLPDRVAVYFDIQTNGTTSAEANDANTVVYNQLKASLIALGFNESQIGTQSYSIYPNTIYNNGRTSTDGYIASHSIKLEFSANDTSKLSSVIDTGANAGAGISTIDFELSTASQNYYKAQALELASQDAKTKADAVAAGFGKSAGNLVSVSVNDFNYYPWPVYSASASGSSGTANEAKAAVMNLAPTMQDVSASVSAIYKLI
ncbi:MAG: SIMPL domain-containing protein [Candidatus Pacearchaeota archaeon]|nr:SIMPL domain-containing protein [Candidatus Pacearchaeota archaeon]